MSSPTSLLYLSIGTQVFSLPAAGIGAKAAEAAGGATFESAAVILAVGTVISAVFYGAYRIIKAVQTKGDEVKHDIQEHTQLEVVKASDFSIGFLDNLRIPAWYKDSMGVMQYINPAYSATFGVMPQQYVGKRDTDVWPYEIGRKFQRHDAEVISRRVEIQFTEEVPQQVNNPHSEIHKWFVVKFPDIDPVTKQIRGVAGYCIPIEMAERAISDAGNLFILTRGELTVSHSAPDPHAHPIETRKEREP